MIIIIPALSSSQSFHGDLLRKLAGVSLIQRSIDLAHALSSISSKVVIVTDSDEIRLMGERNGVTIALTPSGRSFGLFDLTSECGELLTPSQIRRGILVLSPYAPLLTVEVIESAYKAFIGNSRMRVLAPMRKVMVRQRNSGDQDFIGSTVGPVEQESSAFVFLRSLDRVSADNEKRKICFFPNGPEVFEISTKEDWWFCEKRLRRQRIIFRVIGAPDVGMGHIYRCLTIAHEITDHEVIFFTDVANEVAVCQLTKYEYDTHISSKDDIVRKIIDMKPDLVINDILNTRIDDIQPLRDRKIPVINFEDLGDGARSADITINELYETAQLEGSNLLWGSEYFFLRDEFANATPNSFATEVKGLLITFGGTDQHDLSRKILRAIRDTCRSLNVKIFLVTGPGYERFEELEKEVDGDDEIHVTHATGVISEIMEYVQIAVTSNGRTVYELAHMNVPAVVISQHDREQTHLFAQQDRGFIPVGGYDPGKTEIRVHQEVSELLTTQSKRRSLFNGMKQINFEGNKQRVIKIIEELL